MSSINYDSSFPEPCVHCGRWLHNAPSAHAHYPKVHDDYNRGRNGGEMMDAGTTYRCNNCYAKVESKNQGRCGSCGKSPVQRYGRRKRRPF